MEVKQLTQSEFANMLTSAGKETYQTTFEKDVWYEQVIVDEVTYRHKLLSLKKLSSELLTKKAVESQPSVEPIRLRAKDNGPIVALVFNSKSTVFYHLLASTKSEIARAKRMVIYFSKSLLPTTAQQMPETPSDSNVA